MYQKYWILEPKTDPKMEQNRVRNLASIFNAFESHFGTILGPCWDNFGRVLGAKISFGCTLEHLDSILGAFWEHLGYIDFQSKFGCDFGLILGAKTYPKLSICWYLFLKICPRNFADFSFDSALHSAPSYSLKLSSRLHEKQVFVQSLLINFINKLCWKQHKTNRNSIKNVRKIEFQI